jgi:hypothetical protein
MSFLSLSHVEDSLMILYNRTSSYRPTNARVSRARRPRP